MKKSFFCIVSCILLTSVSFATTINSSNQVTKEQVVELYVATFNRAPKAGGLNYWVNESGLTITQIAQSFFDQPETQALYPEGTTNEEFVTAIYKNVFGRSPESGGLNYWVGELKSQNMTRWIMIEAMKNGAQGDDRKLLTNKAIVGKAFAESGKTDIEEARSLIINMTANADSVINALNLISGTGNVSPVANAGEDRSVIVNESITLTGTATDNDGTIVSYEWKEGSTVLATTASFTYTPTVEGSHTLVLTVTDDDGTVGSDSVVVTVRGDTQEEKLVLKYTEQFDNFSPNGGDWTSGGSPLPQRVLVSDAEDGYAWDSNGNGWHHSGSYLNKFRLPWNKEFKVEFRLKQPIESNSNYWLYLELSLNTSPFISDDNYGRREATIRVSGGKPNNGDYINEVSADVMGDAKDRKIEPNYNDGDWHIYTIHHKITNTGEREINILIDGISFHEERNQEYVKNEDFYINMDGRSHQLNNYLDYVKVYMEDDSDGTKFGNFGVTELKYETSSNKAEIVQNIFGSDYRVADWNDLKNYYSNGGDLKELFNGLNVTQAFVTKDGSENTGSRYYFATLHNHNKPSNYLAHDNIDNYLISLGSWYGAQQIMVIKKSIETNNPPTAYETIHLNSRTNYNESSAVSIYLEKGHYKITPIEDKYSTWTAWSSVSGCSSMGEECTQGWLSHFSISYDDEYHVLGNDTPYQTSRLAFEKSKSSYFTLNESTTVSFYIHDNAISDNSGGLSLKLEKYTQSDINLTNGLVAHYEFEGNADDSSGNENHGTQYGGVSYVDGVIGQAGNFDGIDDYIGVDSFKNMIFQKMIASLLAYGEKSQKFLHQNITSV
ncbi:MAG: DUF4214 domain-containing protein [bacterium]